MASRKRKKEITCTVDLSSHTNVRYLTDVEKTERIKMQKIELRKMSLQQNRLVLKLREVSENKSVNVQEDLHEDLCTIVTNNNSKMAQSPSDCFKRIFWEQQSQATCIEMSSKRKDCRAMRWHPLMIRWCLSLRHQSQKAYDKVREVLHLPSQRTLRDYTHYCTGNPGFSTAVDEQLMSAAGIDSLAEWQKCVFILIDEMHIKENLVYEKHSGSVIGFTNLGDINNELLSFEQEFEQGISQPDKPLAKTILTFMVRGIFTSLKFHYAHFPCKNLTGELMFDPFWEAVYRLETCGFKVYIQSIHAST